jgi:predicted DNA-binding protein (UPF0251 family)
MPQHNRAKRGEYVNRVPQSALDDISVQMQEMREQRERDQQSISALVAAITDELEALRIWLSNKNNVNNDVREGMLISRTKLTDALKLAKG